jgi:hypothetical protein
MLHVICATFVLAAALVETTVIRQWTQQYRVAGIQQALRTPVQGVGRMR